MKIKVFFLICLLSVAHLEAQDSTNSSPSDQLQQLTAQLQNSPDDAALRGRIIALVLTFNPKPATPDAVTMAEGAAEYAFKNAKVNSDFSDAAKQYEKALLFAPWLAADYFNCGVAHEKAGENKEAIRNFNLYLLAAPDADDATAVKKRIGGLQYAEQKQISDAAAKLAEENSPETKLKKFINSLDGGVWRCEHSYYERRHNGALYGSPRVDVDAGHTYIAIHGHTASYYEALTYVGSDGFSHHVAPSAAIEYDPTDKPLWTSAVTGHTFSEPRDQINLMSSFSDEFTISDDGQSINREFTGIEDGSIAVADKTTVNFVRIK